MRQLIYTTLLLLIALYFTCSASLFEPYKSLKILWARLWVPNFRLSWQLWLFGWYLLLKGIWVLNRKTVHHHIILNFRISLGTNFQLKLTIFTFSNKFCQKVHFQTKTYHHWIFHIGIRQGTKFQVKLTIPTIGNKFSERVGQGKGYFWSKTEKWTHY